MVWEELKENLIFTCVEARSTDEVFDQLGHARVHGRASGIIRAVCQERPVSSPVSVHLIERHEPDRALARVPPHAGRCHCALGEEEVALGRVVGHELAL